MPRRPFPSPGQTATTAPVHASTGAQSVQSSARATVPCTAAQRLISVIHDGQIAQPRNTLVRDDGEVLAVPFASAMAGAADVLPLGAEITALLEEDGQIYLDPPYQDAGAQITLGAAMSTSSRVIAAGARLITGEEVETTVRVGGEPMKARRKIRFSTFEPAPFGVVDFDADPEAEVPLSPVPVADTELDRDAMTSRAFAFRLSRRDLKAKGREALAAEIVWPVAQGLGRAIDATVFDVLKALPANVWTLGKAAALGVPFGAVRGIVGTSGTGAQAVEGALYVDGTPAELTADMAETFLGVWNRAAVVVDPNIKLIATRLDASGAIEVVCFADMQALLPNPAMFWIVD